MSLWYMIYTLLNILSWSNIYIGFLTQLIHRCRCKSDAAFRCTNFKYSTWSLPPPQSNGLLWSGCGGGVHSTEWPQSRTHGRYISSGDHSQKVLSNPWTWAFAATWNNGQGYMLTTLSGINLDVRAHHVHQVWGKHCVLERGIDEAVIFSFVEDIMVK